MNLKRNISGSIYPLAATVILMLSAAIYSCGQDIHFSQFSQSPFNLNPGLTGQFNGAYRLTAAQRNQWRSVTVPYSTFGFSADARQLEIPDGWLNSRNGETQPTGWNAGLSFFHDKAGDSKLRSTIISLALGKDFSVGTEGNARISPGCMIGLTSMKIDYSDLRYDNQWNGFAYDPGINPEEQYARSSRSYISVNAGVAYIKTWSRRKEMICGASVYNIGNPRQSFFDDGYVKLDMRLNMHGSYKIPVNEDWIAEPMTLFMLQGTYKELNLGGLAHYVLEEKPWMQRTIYAGAFGRARDAGYVVAGLCYDAWNVGISYDINTSNLRPASNGRGGFEITAVYIIPKPPKVKPAKVCPDYM